VAVLGEQAGGAELGEELGRLVEGVAGRRAAKAGGAAAQAEEGQGVLEHHPEAPPAGAGPVVAVAAVSRSPRVSVRTAPAVARQCW
jgi:hypothetical protein